MVSWLTNTVRWSRVSSSMAARLAASSLSSLLFSALSERRGLRLLLRLLRRGSSWFETAVASASASFRFISETAVGWNQPEMVGTYEIRYTVLYLGAAANIICHILYSNLIIVRGWACSRRALESGRCAHTPAAARSCTPCESTFHATQEARQEVT